MRTLQGERLRTIVEYVYHNTPFYRNKMQELGVMPCDINSVDDIVKLPFTTKDDLRDNYPYGLFATPMSEIVRIHASSGTTGKPTVVGYTRKDLSMWSEVMARTMTAHGVTRDDIVHISYGYGLFTGGFGFHNGVECLGGAVVPVSSGNTAKQLQLLQDFKPTAITCTPSYALYLTDAIEKNKISLDKLSLKIGMFGAEPWSEPMRKDIEKRLGIKAYNVYGLSEIIGPGVAHECVEQNGSHIAEDHFIPEIVDPKTFEPLPYGQTGELVFTTITKEGLPLLRYRTKDLTSLTDEPCKCGRTNVRMSRIEGRSDDMLIIRGVNVFPSQIEGVILEMEEVQPHYMLTVDRVNNLDVLTVEVEVSEEHFTDGINKIVELKEKIAHRLHNVLGISAIIKLVEPLTLQRFEGKAQRVIDNRKI